MTEVDLKLSCDCVSVDYFEDVSDELSEDVLKNRACEPI